MARRCEVVFFWAGDWVVTMKEDSMMLCYVLFVVVANLATLHYVNGLRFLGEEKEKMD